MRRWIVVPLLLLLLGVVVVLAGLVALQRHLIYFPSQEVGPPPGWVEEVRTTTEDGLTLRGWIARGDVEGPLLLVFHGNGGTGADRLPLADALRPHGIGVLLTEYRGYGGNPGAPSEEGLTRDAAAWQAWAEANHVGPVAYLGESLGAAVATQLAIAAPPAALILRSPFASLAEVGAVHYPFLPLRWLLADRYEVVDRIAEVEVPVVVIAGDADSLVPLEQSRAVHDATAVPSRLVVVRGAGHNDRELLAGEQLIEAITTTLERSGA